MKAIVLQCADLHLGYLGCYGNAEVATPTFDRLAAEGIVFDQHYVSCPGDRGAILTGRHTFPWLPATAVGPTDASVFSLAHKRPHERKRILQKLQRESVLGDPAWRAAEHGLLVVQLPSLAPPWKVSAEILAAYFDHDEDDLRPWLDPTPGWLARADLAALDRLQRTYAGVVEELDATLGVVVAYLEAEKLLDEVLLLVTSASGLHLGAHGLIGAQRPWLHEEWVHVPLLVRLPGAAQALRRVQALTQTVDVAPTLREASGLPASAMHGVSLWPLLRGEVEQMHAYLCMGAALGEAEEWALRTPEWLLVAPLRQQPGDPPRQPQLYVKPEDRWEVNELAQQQHELLERLQATLAAWQHAVQQDGAWQCPALVDAQPS